VFEVEIEDIMGYSMYRVRRYITEYIREELGLGKLCKAKVARILLTFL
jgi:hypothetical protein